MKSSRRPVLLALAGLLFAVPSLAIAAGAAYVPSVDHHMHLFSPAASRVVALICKAKGDDACPPEVSHAPSTGDDAIKALDQAGIRQGVLLSGGYFFGSPAVADQHIDVAAGTHAENLFTIAQAKAHCGRLIPFISVNPLSPGAIAEIDYWGRRGGATGLKLHLGNSGFNFRHPDEVKRLAAVFAAANRNHLAIVIHLQTQLASYGPEDARIFLRDVAPAARDVPVQIAHAGSGGGLDAGVLAVLGVFAEAFRSQPSQTRNMFFDLAMVPDLFSNTRKLVAKPADVTAFDELIRGIGLRRFVLGSDYTLGLDLAAYYADQKATLALSEAEWRELAANEAPYVEPLLTSKACNR